MRDGLPAHLTGSAGGGRTTLALHLARRLDRPAVLIHGDDQMATSDLVAKESGYRRTYCRDNFIHTALKVEKETRPGRVDKVLAEACREVSTLVYDEFTGSRPEADNVLLSVLEEGEQFPLFQQIRQAEYGREPYLLVETLRAIAAGHIVIRNGEVPYRQGRPAAPFRGRAAPISASALCLDEEIARAMAQEEGQGQT